MRVKKILLGFAMAALSVSATQVLAAGCPTKGVKEMTGAGATFPYPLYSKMFSEYDKAVQRQSKLPIHRFRRRNSTGQ